MLRFIAVHPVAFSQDQLTRLAREPRPAGVIWKSSFCAFGEDKSFCHWEAPSRETVVDVFRKYDIPYEGIYEVRWFDPATGVLEPEPIEADWLVPA
jgi:Nickel responsive protein SCO4226-like